MTMMTACVHFDTPVDTRLVSVRLPRKYNVIDSNLLNRLKRNPDRDAVLNEYWGNTYVSFLDRDRTADLITHYDLKTRGSFHNGVSFHIELMLNERKCKVSVRLFGNGKKQPNARAVIAGGMHDASEVDTVSCYLSSLLTDITSHAVQPVNIEISHIAAKQKLGYNLDLEKTKDNLLPLTSNKVQIIYEPELHHGYMQILIDTEEDKKVTVHVHTKGSMMVMGMNSFSQMQEVKNLVDCVDWGKCKKEEVYTSLNENEDPDMQEFINEIMEYDISAETYKKHWNEENSAQSEDASDLMEELDALMSCDSHLNIKHCKQCSKGSDKEFCTTTCARVYASSMRWKTQQSKKSEEFYTDVQFHIRKMKRMMQLFPKHKFISSMKGDRRLWMKRLQESTCIEQLDDLARQFSCFMVDNVHIENVGKLYEACKMIKNS